MFTYQKLVCEEFQIYIIKWQKLLITNSFPKIDKDLKIGF